MKLGNIPQHSRVLISVLILVVLGLHLVPIVSYQGHRQTTWPFLAWAMYARAYPPGPVRTMNRDLVGTTSAGEEEPVTPRLIGLSRDAFRNGYVNPLYRGDSSTALELITRLNRGRTVPIVALRTDGKVFTLSDTGVVIETLPVIVYRAAASESE